MPSPPLPEQKAIAEILGALDDKIELNRRMNETLEEMARAIFKSWFVDFDPVRAKMDGRKPVGMDAETAKLFPDSFENQNGEAIPKGWKTGTLGEITDVQGGFAFKSKDFGEHGSHPVIKIKNIQDNHTVDIKDVEYLPGEFSVSASEFLLNDGDVLMAMTGAKVAKFGILVNESFPSLLNQRVARFLPSTQDSRPWFVYSALLMGEIHNQIIARAEGSAQPNVSANGIKAALMVVPPLDLILEYNNLFDPLFRNIILNINKSRSLVALRDTLLPKLLSGELRVTDAEKKVEQVL